MATRRIIRRLLIVALVAVATFIVLVIFFTWGVSAGGSGLR
jgi:hypothetical protein